MVIVVIFAISIAIVFAITIAIGAAVVVVVAIFVVIVIVIVIVIAIVIVVAIYVVIIVIVILDIVATVAIAIPIAIALVPSLVLARSLWFTKAPISSSDDFIEDAVKHGTLLVASFIKLIRNWGCQFVLQNRSKILKPNIRFESDRRFEPDGRFESDSRFEPDRGAAGYSHLVFSTSTRMTTSRRKCCLSNLERAEWCHQY
jgi:hypothetical protein